MIFLFLRSLSATIIPSVAVPLSLIGTFGVMYLAGYSLNNLTLMALTISTGFVVDDAIVMIENIVRYIEAGDPPLQAALKGAEQIGFTIVSLTISLIAVLIPLLFMGDIVGRLFREFAITLSVTILVSAVVSLTLTPMMCSRILKHDPQSEQSRFYRQTEEIWQRVINFYERTLRWVLAHQTPTLFVALATFVGTVVLYVVVPKGFFPVQDTGIIQGITEASQKISFPAMAQKQQELAELILKDPAVESISSFIGVDGINTTLNSGRIQINLKPLEERGLNASEVIRELRPKLSGVDGIQFYMQPIQDLTVDDRVSRTQFQFTLSDPDQKELNHWSKMFVEKLKELPEIRDVATDQQLEGQAANLVVDRDTASRLGISAQAIDETLYDAFGQRQISTLYTQLNQYHVILETLPEFQRNPDRLKAIYVRSALAPSALVTPITMTQQAAGISASGVVLTSASTSYSVSSQTNSFGSGSAGGATGSSNPTPTTAMNGEAVPLSAFTHMEEKSMPLSVNHQGQFPVVTVSFNLAKGSSLGAATEAIERIRADLAMPASIQADFQGAAATFKSSLKNEPLLILAALVTVYIVLGVLYESFIHPITILSTLPSAGIGACLALLMTGTELNVVSIIGIVLLIGIVKKNGIMMIDFALEAERKEGKTALEAITQACLLRFRPIMMTTMAALLAGIPLAMGTGIGSELRHPLGISMVGGLLLSQVLTLYTTPVIYIFFDRLAERFART